MLRRKLAGLALGSLLVAGGALAESPTLAVVVPSLDSPVAEPLGKGCYQWALRMANAGFACIHVGPASASDEAGAAAVIADLAGRAEVKGVALSGASPAAAAAARDLRIPVVTIGEDFDQASRAARKTFVGVDDAAFGAALAKLVTDAHPAAGTVCIVIDGAASAQRAARAQAVKEALASAGWKEAGDAPCGGAALDAQAAGIGAFLDAHADLGALVLVAGNALAQAEYAAAMGGRKNRIADKSLVVVAGSTLAPQLEALREGLASGLAGESWFAIGYQAARTLYQLTQGAAPDDRKVTPVDVCTVDTVDTCVAEN